MFNSFAIICKFSLLYGLQTKCLNSSQKYSIILDFKTLNPRLLQDSNLYKQPIRETREGFGFWVHGWDRTNDHLINSQTLYLWATKTYGDFHPVDTVCFRWVAVSTDHFLNVE